MEGRRFQIILVASRAALVLGFALPSLVIYSVALLAFWPAQMSPDSVDQWLQVTNWRFNDVFPVFGTMLSAPFMLVWRSPASVAIAQIVALSLVTGGILAEGAAWNARRWVLVVGAIAFPLYPPNALMVTTLWKDVPFGIALLGMTWMLLVGIRKRFILGPAFWIGLALLGFVCVGVRHNGIIAMVIVFALLALVLPGRRLGPMLAGLAQVAFFVFTKTMLLALLAAPPQSGELRSIVVMPLLGEAVRQQLLTSDEMAVLTQMAPAADWAAIPCDTAVPFYFDSDLDHAALAGHADDLLRIAAKIAIARPLVALRQQVCMDRLFWLPTSDGKWFPTTPFEIWQGTGPYEALGLHMTSVLPVVRDTYSAFNAWANASAVWSIRPALLIAIGLISAVVFSIKGSRLGLLIMLPGVASMLSLALLIQSQEYRFAWPTVIASLLVAVIAMSARSQPGLKR